MVDIDALIAKASANFDTVKPVDAQALLGDEVVTFRFWPMTGPAWRELTSSFPPTAVDAALGYNLDAVLRAYPKVYLVDGDEVTPLAGKFPSICDVLSAPDLKNLAAAVWGLNEYDPAQRSAAAGKASKGGQRKKRSSPSNSK